MNMTSPPNLDAHRPYQSQTLRVILEARNRMIRHAFHKKKHSLERLARDFQLSRRHIKVYILEHNRAPRYRRLQPQQKKLLIQMWETGVPLHDIAARLKCDTSVVKKWKRKFCLQKRPQGRRSK